MIVSPLNVVAPTQEPFNQKMQQAQSPAKVATTEVAGKRNLTFAQRVEKLWVDDLNIIRAEVTLKTNREIKLEKALEKIAKWFGEFPETGKFWEHTCNDPLYKTVFRSNGERDYMRNVAYKALESEESCVDYHQPVNLIISSDKPRQSIT